jgi:hypothetical protein
MVARSGWTKMGCLLTLLIVAAIGYFGVNVGQHFLTDYELRDIMRTEARFAARRSDTAIMRRIAAKVDSLGLPPEAANVRVRRAGGVIFIYTEYTVRMEFPFFVKEFQFTPSVQAPF